MPVAKSKGGLNGGWVVHEEEGMGVGSRPGRVLLLKREERDGVEKKGGGVSR
jgi:hypothetical protein